MKYGVWKGLGYFFLGVRMKGGKGIDIVLVVMDLFREKVFDFILYVIEREINFIREIGVGGDG